ncbi:MAG: virulence-associated E family protein [Bacteroidales bacterium]|nr:virulence-associated E family protein [Bacteroidales bacterium]
MSTQKNKVQKKETQNPQTQEPEDNKTIQERIENFLSFNYEFKFNEITKVCFYRENALSNPSITPDTPFEPVNFDNIMRKIGKKFHFKYGISQLQSTLRSDYVPRYNPFKDWYCNLTKWDGKDYIKALSDCIILSSDKYENGELVEQNLSERVRLETMLKKWLVRAVRCLMGGAINREVFMFFSMEQRIGKSKFFEYLVPTELKNYSLMNPKIKNVGNNELFAPLAKNFIINFDEYDTLIYDGCIPALKSYISSETASYRTLYSTADWVHEPRICSFVASTNIPDFLRDETGNSRYICFDVQKFDYQTYLKTDVNLIWSQAKYLFENGFDCDMTKQELSENNENNIKYLYHTTEYELISKIYEPSGDENDFMTSTEIAQELKESHFKITPQSVGRAMSALKIRRVHSKKDNRQMGYYIRKKTDF